MILFFLLILWSSLAFADATTYHVASMGSDGNPGTAGQPFRTLEHAVSRMRGGDTLVIGEGTYTANWRQGLPPAGVSWDQPTIIHGAPGSRPVLVPTVRVSATSYVVFQDLAILGTKGPDRHDQDRRDEGLSSTSGLAGFIIGGSGQPCAHHIRLVRVEIAGADNQGVSIFPGCDHNEFLEVHIHDNGTNDFEHGFYVMSSHNVIDRSRIYRNAGWGGKFYLEGRSGAVNQNVVRNSWLYDNARVGLRGAGWVIGNGVDNAVINNLIWGNEGGVMVYSRAESTKVYNNTVIQNRAYGIRLDENSLDTQVVNNILWQNEGQALLRQTDAFFQSQNLIDRNPWFVNPGAHDYHLQDASPAIDQGARLREVPFDIDGCSRPVGASHDIGAYEFGGTGCVPWRPGTGGGLISQLPPPTNLQLR